MAKKHVHRYILRNQGRNKDYWVYACQHPEHGDCYHYLPAEKAEGLDTVCWRCGQICKVPKGRPEGRRVKRPHCFKCTKVYKGTTASSVPVDLDKLANMTIDDLLNDDDLFNPDKKKEH